MKTHLEAIEYVTVVEIDLAQGTLLNTMTII